MTPHQENVPVPTFWRATVTLTTNTASDIRGYLCIDMEHLLLLDAPYHRLGTTLVGAFARVTALREQRAEAITRAPGSVKKKPGEYTETAACRIRQTPTRVDPATRLA